MKTKDALEIIQMRLDKNPSLKKTYLEEERNYHIACKIREYRKASGLTQKNLAQLIGTKQSVISRLENAEYEGHSFAILKKIASALDIRVEDLMEKKEENYQVIRLHIPDILQNAASFQNWNSNQIIVKRNHA